MLKESFRLSSTHPRKLFSSRSNLRGNNSLNTKSRRNVQSKQKHEKNDSEALKQLQSVCDGVIQSSLKYNDQLCALDEAVRILTKIVSHPPTSPTLSDDEKLYQKLDGLYSNWKLEQTSIPTLLNSILMLQSNYLLLAKEADDLTTENDRLRDSLGDIQESLRECEKENVIYQKNIKILFRENKKMKNKLKEVKKYAKNIQQSESKRKNKSAIEAMNYHDRIVSGKSSISHEENKDKDLGINYGVEYTQSSRLQSSADGHANVQLLKNSNQKNQTQKTNLTCDESQILRNIETIETSFAQPFESSTVTFSTRNNDQKIDKKSSSEEKSFTVDDKSVKLKKNVNTEDKFMEDKTSKMINALLYHDNEYHINTKENKLDTFKSVELKKVTAMSA